jgi:hypothetical protein
MVGKAALIVIMGFSLIFGIAGQYWNRTNDRAVENFYNYYDSTASHELAISAINILADTIFWASANGTSLKNINIASRSFGGIATYNMFTRPDTLNGDSVIRAYACGVYTSAMGYPIRDTVEIVLRPGRFCSWSFFTGDDNGVYWQTGDTCFGPYHTNTKLCIDGAPVFTQNVTVGTGLTAYNGGSAKSVSPSQLPDSQGDTLKCNAYESGVIIPLPSSLANYNNIAGTTVFNDTTSTPTGKKYSYDVFFVFNADPTKVGYYTQLSSVSGTTVTSVKRVPASGYTTVPISSFGNAGGQGEGSVVVVQNGDIHVSGTMNGRVTFVAEQTMTGQPARISSSAFGNSTSGSFDFLGTNGNTNNGNIVISGNTTYNDKPIGNDASEELALVADNSIMVGEDGYDGPAALSANSTVNINAELFCRSGKFFANNYGKTKMGTLNILGSVAQNVRGPVGTVGSSGTGYAKHYTYDNRFSGTLTSPPYSPSTGCYNIVSFRE